ncbi:hypothetical protein G4V62_00925 [Bacillaceae bacterium SIJ1]|uniref:YqhR family membrane protein n=1 Tax=Litoribacterium kuwaitense TaxID=1398745 RepID=UPI0013EDCFDD|nr:YqhR family membrane protein [Litoribacterium kuwaitense]NGP43592.1 hypothetical protein [Litoribacterium kuwaitense]
MAEDKLQEQTPLAQYMIRIVSIGWYGGLLFSIVGWIASLLSFSTYGPQSFLEEATGYGFGATWLGVLTTLVGLSLLSIVIAFIYHALLRKRKGLLSGGLFGIAIWLILYGVLSPLLPGVPLLQEMNVDSLVTTGCLFLVYGVFVGYSISYEYDEYQKLMKLRHNKESENYSNA